MQCLLNSRLQYPFIEEYARDKFWWCSISLIKLSFRHWVDFVANPSVFVFPKKKRGEVGGFHFPFHTSNSICSAIFESNARDIYRNRRLQMASMEIRLKSTLFTPIAAYA